MSSLGSTFDMSPLRVDRHQQASRVQQNRLPLLHRRSTGCGWPPRTHTHTHLATSEKRLIYSLGGSGASGVVGLAGMCMTGSDGAKPQPSLILIWVGSDFALSVGRCMNCAGAPTEMPPTPYAADGSTLAGRTGSIGPVCLRRPQPDPADRRLLSAAENSARPAPRDHTASAWPERSRRRRRRLGGRIVTSDPAASRMWENDWVICSEQGQHEAERQASHGDVG